MTSEASVRVGAVVPRTTAEGPGVRFAVWAQGCAIHCDGCFNPHFWGGTAGSLLSVGSLIDQALASGAQGVTLLGGEPFEQAGALAAFAIGVRSAGLSVMTFTGHRREYLEGPDGPPSAPDLIAATDLLVDGPYLADKPDLVRPWVGSTNQRFHFVSDRYRHFAGDLEKLPDRVEIRIKPTGQIELNGWARIDQLDELLAETTTPIGRGTVR